MGESIIRFVPWDYGSKIEKPGERWTVEELGHKINAQIFGVRNPGLRSSREAEARRSRAGWNITTNRVIVLAGPGVERTRDAVAALRLLAVEANVGVANTWGAKGSVPVGRPAPPRHGRACKQRDLELLGRDDAAE